MSQVADEATSSLGTGLTYLNARYYDPVASRFISPEPMLDVMDPNTLDPYRYADINRVGFTDATGLWSCPSGAGHDACIATRDSTSGMKTAQQAFRQYMNEMKGTHG